MRFGNRLRNRGAKREGLRFLNGLIPSNLPYFNSLVSPKAVGHGLTIAGYTAGWQFTLSQPITVTQLGRYFSALKADKQINIWNMDATTNVISATISRFAMPDPDNYKFVTITPLVLSPGINYAVTTFEPGTISDPFVMEYSSVGMLNFPITNIQSILNVGSGIPIGGGLDPLTIVGSACFIYHL